MGRNDETTNQRMVWLGASSSTISSSTSPGDTTEVHVEPDFSFLDKEGGETGVPTCRHHRKVVPDVDTSDVVVRQSNPCQRRPKGSPGMVVMWLALHLVLHVVGYLLAVRYLPSARSSRVLASFLYATGLGCSALYVNILRSDPGTIAIGEGTRDRPVDESLEGGYGEDDIAAAARHGWCNTCSSSRPPRSKHCRKCSRCVLRFDHHCPWIGGDIGVGNHLSFLVFVAMQSVHVGLGALVCFIAAREKVNTWVGRGDTEQLIHFFTWIVALL
ncbi:unnamed protein product [Choristocarpus tenellus]